ncbi:hypothetical protein Krac_5724 [Ktedonobacter racemifer DSM 44963]|uniref:Uncharacterized protein n=1 Tax=Ktedonobacter racemifer DSM 44963 TaxID=485913 RepID=D6TWP9_KTERA|nr:hypothetical protein Krac_5724 [Ktedonobacter racemifer DSM 44963]
MAKATKTIRQALQYLYCFPTSALARVLEITKNKHPSNKQMSKHESMSENNEERVDQGGEKETSK